MAKALFSTSKQVPVRDKVSPTGTAPYEDWHTTKTQQQQEIDTRVAKHSSKRLTFSPNETDASGEHSKSYAVTTSKPINMPQTHKAKPAFTISTEKADAFNARCRLLSIDQPRDIAQVYSLINLMHLESEMSFMNFGDTLQHSVSTTNSDLLAWGHAHITSPLTEKMIRATNACQDFYTSISPKQSQPGWKFWAKPSVEQSSESYKDALITVEAHIEIFTDSLKSEKPAFAKSYMLLDRILNDTGLLLTQLKLHSAALNLRLEDLEHEKDSFAVKFAHKVNEARDTMLAKRDSFLLMASTLELQVAQINQMATQQRQKIMDYDHVASVTFPLWRTHALSYLNKQSLDDRSSAWASLMQVHEQIKPR
jgi:hypothetical protein